VLTVEPDVCCVLHCTGEQTSARVVVLKVGCVRVGAELQLATEVETMQKALESARQRVEDAKEKERSLKAKAVQLEKDIERMGREKGQRLAQLEAKCKQAKRGGCSCQGT